MTEFIFSIFSSLIGWYLKKRAKDEQAKKDLITFNEIMHKNGLRSVQMRIEARDQIDRVKEMWKEEENKK